MCANVIVDIWFFVWFNFVNIVIIIIITGYQLIFGTSFVIQPTIAVIIHSKQEICAKLLFYAPLFTIISRSLAWLSWKNFWILTITLKPVNDLLWRSPNALWIYSTIKLCFVRFAQRNYRWRSTVYWKMCANIKSCVWFFVWSSFVNIVYIIIITGYQLIIGTCVRI